MAHFPTLSLLSQSAFDDVLDDVAVFISNYIDELKATGEYDALYRQAKIKSSFWSNTIPIKRITLGRQKILLTSAKKIKSPADFNWSARRKYSDKRPLHRLICLKLKSAIKYATPAGHFFESSGGGRKKIYRLDLSIAWFSGTRSQANTTRTKKHCRCAPQRLMSGGHCGHGTLKGR